MTSSGDVGLTRYLAARVGPLALALFVVVSVSAPVAYLLIGARGVQARAQAAADQLAEALAGEIQEQPLLWRYNVLKILPHVRAHTAQADVVRIEITDAEGIPIDVGLGSPDAPDRALVWADAGLRSGLDGGSSDARVWVGASLDEVERESLGLLTVFVVLGSLSAALVYGLPVRAMRAAEARIGGLVARLRDSRQELKQLNETLEGQVRDRSAALQRALDALQEQAGRAARLQEGDRRAISRELHDAGGQALTAIRINLQLIAERSTDADCRRIAERTIGLADTTLEDVRRIVDRLGPSILDDMGLAAAVERYCDDFAERTGVEVVARIACPDRLDGGLESACYRALQEMLTNVARHAAAHRVEVELSLGPTQVELRVADDGRGFSPAAVAELERRGLAGLRERAALLGGQLELDSSPGAGTRITMRLPRSDTTRAG
jgi:signal transduction histidine kinase